MTTRETVGFTTTEVAVLAGVTYRQLDYWARNGILEPSLQPAGGSGSARVYSSEDVAHAKVLGRLGDLGFTHSRRRTDTLSALLNHLSVEIQALLYTLEETPHANHRRDTR